MSPSSPRSDPDPDPSAAPSSSRKPTPRCRRRRHWCAVPHPNVEGSTEQDGDYDGEPTGRIEQCILFDSMSASTIAAAALGPESLSSSSKNDPFSTHALASRAHIDSGSNASNSNPHKTRAIEATHMPDDEDADDNGENRPLHVVYCDPSSASSNSKPLGVAPRPDNRRARSEEHPLSMVEQYVRSYALNLPSPNGKMHRKKAASGKTPPRHNHHHIGKRPRGGAASPGLSPPSSALRMSLASNWSGAPRPYTNTTASPASERRRLRSEALSGTSGSPSSSPSSSSAAAALTGGPWADSPRSHKPVLLSCLNGPAVTAAELWVQAHDDHLTNATAATLTTAASSHQFNHPAANSSPRSHASGNTANATHFHEIDSATVALLGDRKRYRVDVDSTTHHDFLQDDDPKSNAAASLQQHVPLSSSSSYTIRIVHELTGRVGTTIPVATLVANAASPKHQRDRDDDKDDSNSEPSEKRRKVMPAAPPDSLDFDVEVPPGSCPLHGALSGVCSAVKKAKGAMLLLSPPRPLTAAGAKATTATTPAATEQPELFRSERGRLV